MSNALNLTIIKMLQEKFSVKDVMDSLNVTLHQMNMALSAEIRRTLTIRQIIDLEPN